MLDDNHEEVEQLEEMVPESVEEKEVPVTEPESVPVTEPTTDAPTIPDSNGDKKKKSRVGIPILILLFICAGVAAYYCFFANTEEEKGEEKQEETIQTDSPTVYSSYRMSGNSIENFDLYFLKLENNSANVVYSPLSIKYALEMLAEGANGETKKQLDDVIGDYKPNKYPNNQHMSFANAMFIKDSFNDSVKDSYKEGLKSKFNAEVILDPFASPDNINNWVSDRTFKLINNLLDSVSDNDFFLINALAIDMNWNNQIHCALGHDDVPCLGGGLGTYSVRYDHEKVKDDDNAAYSHTEYPYDDEHQFYHLDFNGQQNTKASGVLADFNRYDIIKEVGEDNIRKTVTDEYTKWLKDPDTIKMIEMNPGFVETDVSKYVDKYIDEIKSNYGKASNNTDFMLYDGQDVKVFAKDLKEYDGITLQYVGIMPKEGELSEYINNVKADDINKVIQNLKEVKIDNFKEGVATIIRGDIPLFKYDYELKLVDGLKKLGITDVFGEKSDLSNMIEGPAVIDKAIHKADIEFSNDGIKAAAATAMGGFGATSGGFEYLYKIPVEEIDLTFNKPYMYIIRDKNSGEVWFVGAVYQPIHE